MSCGCTHSNGAAGDRGRLSVGGRNSVLVQPEVISQQLEPGARNGAVCAAADSDDWAVSVGYVQHADHSVRFPSNGREPAFESI